MKGAIGILKNEIHGSRAYLQQVTRKVIDNKNFFNLLNEENFHYKSLFDFTQNILKQKKHSTGNLSNSLVLKSPRAKVKNIIFHSLSYNKRGNSNNYTVSFDSCGFDVYCQIKCFFSCEEKIYAIVNKFLEIEDLDFPFSKKYSKWINKNTFKNFFTINENNQFELDIMNMSTVICKCLLINNDVRSYLTKLVYDFEHD